MKWSIVVPRRIDNKGFTLAELLIVVAIVVVLLAVALPSVFAAQKNLLLDEANASATAIANAAQSEMTIKKVDGTWASLVREEDGTYKTEFPAATGASDNHIRYMTDQTALDLGIISNLSVEQNVLDGHYIIEFDGLTASVTRVFYTNGSLGLFGARTLNAQSQVALLSYYQNAPADDDPSLRVSYQGCVIGLFEGTADGATPGAALIAPSVSTNDYGKTVLTNLNLRDADDGTGRIDNMLTQVQFSYPVEDATYTLTISSMTKNYSGDNYVVTASDGTNEYTCSFSNAPASNTSVYTVEANSRYEIDLNDLASVLEDNKSDTRVSEVWRIVQVMQDKSIAEAQSKLEAVCTVSADKCLSVTGRAFIDWPAKVPTLKVYVTDPDPRNVDTVALGLGEGEAAIPSYISGTYTSPEVTLVDESGNEVNQSILSSYTGLISESMLKASFSLLNNVWVNGESGNATKLPVKSDWFYQMQRENVQEGSQTYSGKVIKIDTANTIDANVLVTVGSYTSNSSSYMTISNSNGGTITYDGKTKTNAFNGVRWPTDNNAEQTIYSTGAKHDYQIYEVWLDDGVSNHRVGYFQGDDWVWDDDILSDCVYDANTKGKITADTTQLVVDSSALMSKAGALSKYQNYSLYVRTAPKASEALDWFDEHSYTFVSYIGSSDNTTDQRGQNYSRPIRWLLENEFGASTTVAAWTVSTSSVTSGLMRDQGGQSYPTSSSKARIYYTTLPAVAWNTGGQLDSRYLELPNAQLMLYDWNKGTKALNRITFANGENTMYSHNVNGETYQVRATASADLAMTPSYDHMFYRVLTYFDSDGKTRFTSEQLSQQYTVVPLDGAGDARFPEAPDKSGVTFVGWKVTSSSGTFTVSRNEDGTMPKIADYVDQMKYGNVSLTAQYREGCNEKIGLVYIDNYDGGTYRFTGYLNADSNYADDKSIDAGTISGSLEPGYYMSYYVGTSSVPKVDIAGSSSVWGGKYSVSESYDAQANIDNKRYALYKVTFSSSSDAQLYITVKCKMVGNVFNSAAFYCNSIFGGMVANDEDTAKTFGRASNPWRVYNADMFPGVVQSRLQDIDLAFLRKLLENNSTVANSTNRYVQMRDIDFASTDSSALKQWPVAFAGTYDGNGKTIRNAQNGFTKAPTIGASTISTIGTVAVGSTTSNVEVAEGLFPVLLGKDKNNPALVSNVKIEVGSYDSDAQLFGVATGFARQASFSGITVTGKPASDQTQARIALTNMGKNGTADMFYASGSVVGRVQAGYVLEKCSAENIAFDIDGSTLRLANNRNVFGGLVGVLDTTGNSSSSEVVKNTKSLSVNNVSVNLTSSLGADKNATACIGGFFGRFYVNGTVELPSGMEWSCSNVSLSNESGLADTNVYAGAIAATYGGSVRVYNGSFDCSNITYTHASSSFDLLAVFAAKRSIASNGLISGSEWCLVNAKKASEALAEAAKIASTASTASEDAASSAQDEPAAAFASVASDAPDNDSTASEGSSQGEATRAEGEAA